MKIMAEREGFEPSERDKPFGSLAGNWFKPLTHRDISEALVLVSGLGPLTFRVSDEISTN